MEERTIKVNKDTAISWYRSDNIILKTLALQAFSKEELDDPVFYLLKQKEKRRKIKRW